MTKEQTEKDGFTPKETKYLMQRLRVMVLRYRRDGKSDKTAIANFVYGKGLPRETVEEWYQILVDAERLNTEYKP